MFVSERTMASAWLTSTAAVVSADVLDGLHASFTERLTVLAVLCCNRTIGVQ